MPWNFRTPSPINFVLDNYDAVVIPDVRGTETILEAALKAGPQLSSVVVTPSVAAITNYPAEPGYVFTGRDFVYAALDVATKNKAEGIKTPEAILYSASKTTAKRTVWKFI